MRESYDEIKEVPPELPLPPGDSPIAVNNNNNNYYYYYYYYY
jgi:hypothetical protein